MKTALHRVFRKNLPLLLAILFAFIGLKVLSVRNVLEAKIEYRYLDDWIQQCQAYDDTQLDAFYRDTLKKLSDDKSFKEAADTDWRAFSSSYSNVKYTRQLIGFAQDKEGMLPTNLPDNYFALLDYYSTMDLAMVINEQPLDLYFKLQDSDAIAILVLLLCVVIWGVHYESEIYKYALTAKNGGGYSRTVRCVLLLLSLGMLFANELADLVCSGVLQTPGLLSAPAQSYKEFCRIQMRGSIGTLFGLMWCGKILGTVLLVLLAEWIARKKKSLKDTAVYAMCGLFVLLFLGKGLTGTPFCSVLQVGLVDWKTILAETVLLLPAKLPSVVLGLLLSSLTMICFIVAHCFPNVIAAKMQKNKPLF